MEKRFFKYARDLDALGTTLDPNVSYVLGVGQFADGESFARARRCRPQGVLQRLQCLASRFTNPIPFEVSRYLTRELRGVALLPCQPNRPLRGTCLSDLVKEVRAIARANDIRSASILIERRSFSTGTSLFAVRLAPAA